MKRNAYQILEKWKNKKNRKPLLITGVRQCGKNEFEEVMYFNFESQKGLHSIFDYDFDVHRILDEFGSLMYIKLWY